MINEEFAFVVNVIMGQSTNSVLGLALRAEGISNVESLLNLTEDRIDRIQFRNCSPPFAPVDTRIGNALKELMKTFRKFFYDKLSKGFSIHQDRQNLRIQEEFREFAVSTMGSMKYYVAHGHVYMDDDQGREIEEGAICPHCGDGNFILSCDVCNDGDDDEVNHLVADLENFVNFRDDELHFDLISERNEFEEIPLVFDTEDRTGNYIVIDPDDTEIDDESADVKNNNSQQMEFYSPCIPHTLSFSPFHLNKLAGENEKKEKQIILREKMFPSKIPRMSNPINFGKKELKGDNRRNMAFKFPTKLPMFYSGNIEDKIKTLNKPSCEPSCEHDIIGTGSYGDNRFHDEHSRPVMISIAMTPTMSHSPKFASIPDSKSTTTNLRA